MFEPPTTETDSFAEHRFQRALRDYLRTVAATFGIGVESYTVDWDTPTSAYLALDEHLPHYPDRDLALLWQEDHGWSAAIDNSCREDLIVVDYLGGPTIAPEPDAVARFVLGLRATSRHAPTAPPTLRDAGRHDELADQLLATVRHRPAAQPRARPPAAGHSAPTLTPVC